MAIKTRTIREIRPVTPEEIAEIKKFNKEHPEVSTTSLGVKFRRGNSTIRFILRDVYLKKDENIVPEGIFDVETYVKELSNI